MENNKITGNEPAMPIVMGKESDQWYIGLTIRQQFAMAAMQGILSGIYANKEIFLQIGIEAGNDKIGIEQYVAGLSLENADALIAELNK